MVESYNEDKNFLHDTLKSQEDQSDSDNFIDQYIKYVDRHLFTLFPKQHDARTADAIVELFRKRENLDIFNKKGIYIYIREITDQSTPQITKVIKRLKSIYKQLFSEYLEHGYVKI